jgi:PAS domain S-box-containing protein
LKDSDDSFGGTDVFRAAFDEAPIGTAITAPDGTWRRVNAQLAAMLGYSIEEMQATSFLGLTHPDHLPSSRTAVEQLLSGERETWALEKRLVGKDGHSVWMHITTRARREPSGAPHLLSYFLDITERKRADQRLLDSEVRYRRLFESAKDGILILDASSGMVVDVNPFMTELTGFPREAFLGKQLWHLGPFEDAAASQGSFAELQATDYVRYEDLPLTTRSGSTVAVEFVSNVYLVDGKRVIQCNIRDITARKVAEAELRLRERAIEAVPQGIVITDPSLPDNPIIYVSPGFARMTGYEREEILGRNCRFLNGPSTDRAQLALLSASVRLEQPHEVALLNFRKDGTSFWNNVAISPIRDAAQRVTHFVGVLTDVTARRQLEAQFFQAQKMEAVGRLAGGVAHDFNNLLSVILSYAEMIGSDLKPDDPLRGDIEQIRIAAVRATDLTRQLLAFSRQQVLEMRVVNLNEILGGMEKMLGRLLGADIEVTMLTERVLGNVQADPGQLEQVIMNLAVNARDAMPRGGKLTLETANIVLDEAYAATHHDVTVGAYVELAVTDTGSGMSKETLTKVFEPFFTTKERGKGTGLGLATVFGIVKQSGGHVFVYSEPDRGTTFKVYLPRVGGTSAPLPSHAPQPSAPDADGGTILLVEDEEQVRTIACTILRRQGYVVLVASNGGEALLICEQHPANIDLLLTDVVLPRMSGRQLAERLAPVRPLMKVLYMSGYSDDAILQHGVIESGVAFLQKPFTPGSLTQKVHEVLRRASMRG